MKERASDRAKSKPAKGRKRKLEAPKTSAEVELIRRFAHTLSAPASSVSILLTAIRRDTQDPALARDLDNAIKAADAIAKTVMEMHEEVYRRSEQDAATSGRRRSNS